MKAEFINEWKIELDNEAVKAIRFVNGFNTDLRVSLSGIDKMELWRWITNNEISLFGTKILDRHPELTDPAYEKYERMIDDVVLQIIR